MVLTQPEKTTHINKLSELSILCVEFSFAKDSGGDSSELHLHLRREVVVVARLLRRLRDHHGKHLAKVSVW